MNTKYAICNNMKNTAVYEVINEVEGWFSDPPLKFYF